MDTLRSCVTAVPRKAGREGNRVNGRARDGIRAAHNARRVTSLYRSASFRTRRQQTFGNAAFCLPRSLSLSCVSLRCFGLLVNSWPFEKFLSLASIAQRATTNFGISYPKRTSCPGVARTRRQF